VPEELWPEVKAKLGAELEDVRMGDPRDFENFFCAVIDEAAFDSIVDYVEHARASDDAEIVFGGGHSKEKGWFVEPTVILAKDPKYRSMCEEIFGPVLTVHVYDGAKWQETLDLVDGTSPYALTGAVFADDRGAVREAMATLRHSAGNFYVNDKPTGAVVGQQPFGGARASGTNDKAGSYLNLIRWVSPRSVKETLVPPTDWRYPFLRTGVKEEAADALEKIGESLGVGAEELLRQVSGLGGSLKGRFGRMLEREQEEGEDRPSAD
jgi:1-pyrroline-5-carboxylate dehydrogenase